MRDDKPHRAAMLPLEGCARPGVGEQVLRPREIGHCQVRRVAVVAGQRDEARLVLHPRHLEQRGDRDALPQVVVAAPLRDAVDVVDALDLRQGAECVEREPHRRRDQPLDAQAPIGRRHRRLHAEIEHGKVLHQPLAGRQPIALRRRGGARQQAPFARPLLLGRDQLVLAPARQGHLVLGHDPAFPLHTLRRAAAPAQPLSRPTAA
jgi:hypothetical protein